MNEAELKRLFRGIILAAVPMPALVSIACSDQPAVCNGRCGGTYDASSAGGAAGAGHGGSGGLTDPCAAAGAGGCAPAYCVMTAIDAGAGGSAVLDCAALCNAAVSSCEYVASNRVKCRPECARRRASDSDGVDDPDGQLARYFAEMAALEAGAVPAFRELRRELAFLGAPLGLRRAAHRAARDEVRHARLARRLARRFGGEYRPPAPDSRAPASLERMATENAAAGCVGETFGALIATWQARRALDPVVRRAMRAIARDEVRHAVLSWRIARWAEGRLDAEARIRVRAQRRAAAQALVRRQKYAPVPALEVLAGVPRSAQASAMALALFERLWA